MPPPVSPSSLLDTPWGCSEYTQGYKFFMAQLWGWTPQPMLVENVYPGLPPLPLAQSPDSCLLGCLLTPQEAQQRSHATHPYLLGDWGDCLSFPFPFPTPPPSYLPPDSAVKGEGYVCATCRESSFQHSGKQIAGRLG